MKRRIDEFRRTKYFTSIVCAVLFAVVFAIGSALYIVHADDDVVVVEDKVSIGNKTYTKDNPLTIIELVPDKTVGTWGYLSGINNGAVKWEDVASLPAGDDAQKQSKKKVCDTWIANYCRYIFYNGGNAYYEGWVEYRNKNSNGVYGAWTKYSFTDNSDSSSNVTSGTQLRFQYINPITNKLEVFAIYDKELVDKDGNAIEKNDNILSFALFGDKSNSDMPSDYYMSDKIRIVTVTPAELNENKELVEEADALVLSSGEKVNYISANTYKTMYDYAVQSGNKELQDKYKAITGITDRNWDLASCNSFNANNCYFGMDLSAEVAGRIYARYQNFELSVIGDAGVFNASNKQQLPNLYKLFILLTCIDRDTCHFDLCENELTDAAGNLTGIYEGEYGRLDLKNMKLYIRHVDSNGQDVYDEVPDSDWYIENYSVFSKYLCDWPSTNGYSRDFPYSMYNGSQYRINDNLLIWGTKDSLFSQGFISGSVDSSNKENGNLYNENNKFEDTDKLYSVDGKVAASKMVQYVFGGYSTLPYVEKLNVLEIQPSEDYKYVTYESVVDVLKYFKNIRFKTSQISEKTYKRYVNVTSVTTSQLNGMTDNIANKYDLVIIDDNNTKNILNVKGTITQSDGSSADSYYYPQGAVMDLYNHDSIKNSAYIDTGKDTVSSGTDITDKTYKKLEEYINQGKPFILTSTVYNANTNNVVMAGVGSNRTLETNIYKAAALAKTKGNTTLELTSDALKNISDDSKIEYKYSPQIKNVTAQGIDSTTNKFSVKFKTDDTTATYNIELYIDKDANGVFVKSDDDSGELFASGDYGYGDDGYITVTTTELPEEMRPYLPWKLVVKNSEGLTSETIGTILLSQTQAKEVKVLQITPIKTNTLPLNSTRFIKYFNDATDITGLKLSSNNVDIVTVDDFCNSNEWYLNSKYEAGKSMNTDDDLLKDYTIVVLGFEDKYSNINNTHALANLKDYIESGKAVLMTHDTLGTAAYSDENTSQSTDELFAGLTSSEESAVRNAAYNWGFYDNASLTERSYMFTIAFRKIIGMDKYGVSVGKGISGLSYQQGYTNFFLARYAKMKNGKDIIYNVDNAEVDDKTKADPIKTSQVNKLNDGQITSYPYEIPDTLKVAETHGQYYQLDLEKQDSSAASIDSGDDVVVWYTLGQNGVSSTPSTPTVTENKPKVGLEVLGNKYWGYWSLSDGSIKALMQPANASGNLPYYQNATDNAIPVDGSYLKLNFTSANSNATGNVSVTMKAYGSYPEEIAKGIIVYKDSSGNIKTAKKDVNSSGYTTIELAKIPANTEVYIYLGREKDGRIVSSKADFSGITFTTNSEKNTYTYNWTGQENWDGNNNEILYMNDNYLLTKSLTVQAKGSSSTTTADRSAFYSATGQDAANNYYIYSKGNITYSGAGHETIEDEDELKLFVNTIVWAINSGNTAPEVVATSAVMVDGSNNMYEQYSRDEYIPDISFVASDKDMGANTDSMMSSGTLFWDKNGDGKYNSGDVIIQKFDKTSGGYNIFNRVQMTFKSPKYTSTGGIEKLASITYALDSIADKDMNESADTAKAYSDMNAEMLRTGSVYIGLEAKDSKGASGRATIHIINRELFKLN